ncbi:MAG: hypothetical protein AB7L17_06035 [Ilumatobacteraceae bacterium]
MGPKRGLIVVLVVVLAACTGTAQSSTGGTRSCIPAPMLRLDGVEYQNEAVADRVDESELRDVIGTITTLPSGLGSCDGLTLHDGEGTVAPGTDVYAIAGVEPDVAVAAFYGSAFLRFNAR